MYGKILILTFEESEDNVIDDVSIYVQDSAKCNLSFQDLVIDISQRMVLCNGEEKVLTYTEFEILYLLASNPGRVFSKEQIYDMIWNESCFGDYNIVMSHIRNLRQKIEDNPSKPIYIQTVWGVGYRFNKNLSSGL